LIPVHTLRAISHAQNSLVCRYRMHRHWLLH